MNVKALELAIEMVANKHKQDWLDFVKDKLGVSKNDIKVDIRAGFSVFSVYLDVYFIVAHTAYLVDKKRNFRLIFKNGSFKNTFINSEKFNRFSTKIGIKIHKDYERNLSAEDVIEIYERVFSDLETSLANIKEVVFEDFVYKAKLKEIEIKNIIEKSLEMYNAEAFKSDLKQVDNKKYEFDFDIVFKAKTSFGESDLEIKNKLNYSFDKDFGDMNIKVNLLIHLQKETEYVVDFLNISLTIEKVLKEIESIFKSQVVGR